MANEFARWVTTPFRRYVNGRVLAVIASLNRIEGEVGQIAERQKHRENSPPIEVRLPEVLERQLAELLDMQAANLDSLESVSRTIAILRSEVDELKDLIADGNTPPTVDSAEALVSEMRHSAR